MAAWNRARFGGEEVTAASVFFCQMPRIIADACDTAGRPCAPGGDGKPRTRCRCFTVAHRPASCTRGMAVPPLRWRAASPINEASAAMVARTPNRTRETHMFSILLLDDEPHVLSALRRTLRSPLGEQVRMETFTDPHAALSRVAEHTFDLLMSDFRMPEMDGIQFLRYARALQPHALRMIVSASTEVNGVMSAINDVGVFRYIVKPWTTELLVDDVRAALAASEASRNERALADATRVKTGQLGRVEAERRRLEELEPGLTHVEWGPNGEVVMPPLHLNAG